jgi:hypothetical protein
MVEHQIQRLLLDAAGFDSRAREARREAGRLLAQLRSEWPQQFHEVVALLGLDSRSTSLLIEMACGGKEVSTE